MDSISYDIFFHISKYLSIIEVIKLTSLNYQLYSLRSDEVIRIVTIHKLLLPTYKQIKSIHFEYENIPEYNSQISLRDRTIYINTYLIKSGILRVKYDSKFSSYRIFSSDYIYYSITPSHRSSGPLTSRSRQPYRTHYFGSALDYHLRVYFREFVEKINPELVKYVII